jgi:hypothetical protein
MGAAKAQPNNVTIAMFVCPSRRDARVARGKRDYGYAATSGIGSASQSIFDTPGRPGAGWIAEGVELTMIHDKGTANTLLLSHVWMRPVNYAGGDPTDLGWTTFNNSRSVNNTAKHDNEPSGSTSYIGGPHPRALPSLFADGSVRPVPYDFANWNLLWAWDNTQSFEPPK